MEFAVQGDSRSAIYITVEDVVSISVYKGEVGDLGCPWRSVRPRVLPGVSLRPVVAQGSGSWGGVSGDAECVCVCVCM